MRSESDWIVVVADPSAWVWVSGPLGDAKKERPCDKARERQKKRKEKKAMGRNKGY